MHGRTICKKFPAGGGTGLPMSAFLAVLVPEDRSANSLVFTVSTMMNYSSEVYAAISLVVNTFPMTGLYLNDQNLVDLDWQPVVHSHNWFATLEIESGVYNLYSTEVLER